MIAVEFIIEDLLTPLAESIHRHGLSRGVTEIAVDIASEAEDNAPIETGALYNSIAVSSKILDTYYETVADAERYRQNSTIEADIKTAPDKYSAWVYSVVFYAIHQEFGTVNNSAQPFFIPAVESVGSVSDIPIKADLEAQYASRHPIVKHYKFG